MSGERADRAGPDWIAVDWGTSNLRAWAMDAEGRALAETASPRGMGGLAPEDFGAALAGALGVAAAGNPALVLLSYEGCPGLPAAGDDTIVIALPAAPRDQLLTLEAMALGCLCHLIEVNLFGS